MADVKKRRGRPRGPGSVGSRQSRKTSPKPKGSPVSDMMTSVKELVSENQALKKEVGRLEALLTRISSLAGESAPVASVPTRRRRRSAGDVNTPAGAVPANAKVKRTRRKITDPIALENRRNALAKARAVRAERLRSGE